MLAAMGSAGRRRANIFPGYHGHIDRRSIRCRDSRCKTSRQRMTGLHVALVGPGFPPQDGGIGLVLGRMAERLASLGCRVEVLVQYRHDEGPLPSEAILPSGVVVRRFRSISRSRRFPLAPSLASFPRQHRHQRCGKHGAQLPCDSCSDSGGAVPWSFRIQPALSRWWAYSIGSVGTPALSAARHKGVRAPCLSGISQLSFRGRIDQARLWLMRVQGADPVSRH